MEIEKLFHRSPRRRSPWSSGLVRHGTSDTLGWISESLALWIGPRHPFVELVRVARVARRAAGSWRTATEYLPRYPATGACAGVSVYQRPVFRKRQARPLAARHQTTTSTRDKVNEQHLRRPGLIRNDTTTQHTSHGCWYGCFHRPGIFPHCLFSSSPPEPSLPHPRPRPFPPSRAPSTLDDAALHLNTFFRHCIPAVLLGSFPRSRPSGPGA